MGVAAGKPLNAEFFFFPPVKIIMKAFFCVLYLTALLLLGACARYEWSSTAPDGTTLLSAQAQCRAQARELVREIRPMGEYDTGPAGFPLESPRDLENQETERCIAGKGFEKIRVE